MSRMLTSVLQMIAIHMLSRVEHIPARCYDVGKKVISDKSKVTYVVLLLKCIIRVYTLDGDLVRELEHDFAPGDPMGRHHQWDLITRNTQLVVSGLYYWTVEDEDGEVQIGKLAIIM